MEDQLLLQRFVREDSQEAFAALTARYLNFVFAICRRELADTETAEDVTQAVFLILARKAPSLGRNVVLSGWLFQTARFAAKNARLQSQRRASYEQKAAEALQQQNETEDATWAELEPLLNQSLAALKGTERDSVLLRFFQGASFAEIGATLGLSEEAARKRVTRALEKMRWFFTKNGVIVPVLALPVLLTAHAAKAAPVAISANIASLISSVLAGHSAAALTDSHAYQISEGIGKTMKIAKMKLLSASAAVVLVGSAVSYGMLHGQAPDQKTAYRTAILTGKVRYDNGKPAGGVTIRAQLQNASLSKIMVGEHSGPTSTRINDLMLNVTDTKPDGTYALAIGDNLPYNIMHLPYTIMRGQYDDGWVASAVVGVMGRKNQRIVVPDLILTHGTFVVGTVNDKASGKAIAGVLVGSQGPECPDSSESTIDTHSDEAGHYRLRVIPGKCMVYIADGQYNGFSDDQAKVKGLMKTITTTAGQYTTVDFQVTPK